MVDENVVNGYDKLLILNNSEWDLGRVQKRYIFPLSDSWHNMENRKKDCTGELRSS